MKYSFERSIKIQDANGAAIYLLGSITDTADDGTVTLNEGAIETPDDQTVVFHLDHPDTTFQYVLTYPGAAAIVDEDVFPADTKLADEEIIGSGPYKLSQYKAGEQAVLELNDQYTGDNTGQAPQVFVKYYSEPSALKLAAENGEVDVAWRSLSPDRRRGPQEQRQGHRGHRRGLRDPLLDLEGRRAGRQAAARPPGRRAGLSTARPSRRTPTTARSTRSTRSSRPATPARPTPSRTTYGEPDPAKAKKILDDAGIKTPVDLTVGWTPTHYGPSTEDEANEVKRQLDESGLFNVTLKSTEWEQYQTIYKEGAYDLFILGWFPDYPDTDDYLSPFLVDGGFFQNGYKNPEAEQARRPGAGHRRRRHARGDRSASCRTSRRTTSRSSRRGSARTPPSTARAWTGVEDTLDPSFIFRFWLVSKSG